MHNMEELKYMLCDELDEYSRAGKIKTLEDLKAIDMLTHSIKSIDTIMAMEDAGYSNEYSNRNYSYGYSNARGRGSNARRDSMGRYSSGNDRMMTSNNYSRGDIKEEIMEKLRELEMSGNHQ